MLYLKNLSSTEVFTAEPWDIEVDIPKGVSEDKKARDEWINRPTTKHCCYTFWEGTNPKLRVRTSRDSENPPLVCHGLALDFDAPATTEEIREIVLKLPLPVWAIEHTLTPGHWRALLKFEEPLRFSSIEMAKHFLKTCVKKWKIGAGWDKSAFLEPNRYYTSSGNFTRPGDVVPSADVRKLEAAALKGYKFAEFSEAINIPLEEIEAALEAKYPDFRRLWDAPFEAEAQGPSFWIPESNSPKSAIVKLNGIFTFSDHAEKPFYSWRSLLGDDFIGEKEETLYGKLHDHFARTQKNFHFRNFEGGAWKCLDRVDAIAQLEDLGFSPRAEDGGQSPLKLAMMYIMNNCWVEGAAPVLFRDEPIIREPGRSLVNNLYGQNTLMQPAPGAVKWGPDGPFPFLCKFFDHFLVNDPEGMGDPAPYFFAWLARFYRAALEGKPLTGQALIHGGGVGIGKTFYTQVILKYMFGPIGDPIKFLTGNENFGGELLSKPVWAINDAGGIASGPAAKIYAARLKEIVANASLDYHVKFMAPVSDIQWTGRIVGTCNTDAASIRTIIPPLDQSNRDKLMIIRAPDKPFIEFPERDIIQEIIKKELPYFCRWLLDFVIPDFVIPAGAQRARFGVKSFYDSTLSKQVALASTKHNLETILRRFAKEVYDKDTENSFDSADLYELLCQRFPAAMKSNSMFNFVQQLETITNDEATNSSCFRRLIDEHGGYQWKVDLD